MTDTKRSQDALGKHRTGEYKYTGFVDRLLLFKMCGLVDKIGSPDRQMSSMFGRGSDSFYLMYQGFFFFFFWVRNQSSLTEIS